MISRSSVMRKEIDVTPTNNLGNASHFWIADPTSSDLDIHVDSDPDATTATFVREVRSSLIADTYSLFAQLVKVF
jgi:hypothetical protein